MQEDLADSKLMLFVFLEFLIALADIQSIFCLYYKLILIIYALIQLLTYKNLVLRMIFAKAINIRIGKLIGPKRHQ